MRTILILLLAVLVGGMFTADAFAEDGGHEYIGVKKCSMCHKGEKKGNMFEIWESSAHAQAYATLGTEEAKAVAAEMGIEDPQASGDCLKCHVTGYGAEASLTENIDPTNGITCEACHGAGGDYKSMSIMKDREKSIANGMVANPKDHCVDCHNEESPTYKPFAIDEFWPKIEHSTPDSE